MTERIERTNTPVVVRVLGPLQVVAGPAVATLARPTEGRLLTRLVVEPGAVVRSDQLVAAIWGDSAPATVDKAVLVHLGAVRRRLEPGREAGVPWRAIATVPGGYRLDPELVAVDWRQFERRLRDGQRLLHAGDAAGSACVLEEGLAMWRGPALGACGDLDFARPLAARLESARADALELLADAHLRLGHPGHALARLEQLLDRDPSREPAIALFTTAVRRLGDGDGRDVRALVRAARTRLDALGRNAGPRDDGEPPPGDTA
jgi:DNA-binding SARP family transcriptional activator